MLGLAIEGLATGILTIIVIIALADTVFRGIALWHSAQKKQMIWFIALLILNTMCILPLIYLFTNVWNKK